MHPVGKSIRWIEKWMTLFFDGHDELYHHAKFGEDRTTRAGCRCENVVFVRFLSRSESGAPCVRGVHSSNTHCVVVLGLCHYPGLNLAKSRYLLGIQHWNGALALHFIALIGHVTACRYYMYILPLFRRQ